MAKIVIEFPDEGSQMEMTVTLEGVMVTQVAAAAWRLEMAAMDMHHSEQARQMMQKTHDSAEAIEIARSMPRILTPSGGN